MSTTAKSEIVPVEAVFDEKRLFALSAEDCQAMTIYMVAANNVLMMRGGCSEVALGPIYFDIIGIGNKEVNVFFVFA